ncbi:hypothetical protein L596_020667 [Steinernema carpocapsae]|uniref:EF-hand domain-containing protein n=1 Tax=Steinernema carpocapsae TaxID=34508 RepID=A0A4U5MUA5_STECR|nr:hypothetical protein L596_020667 [Steinernema carpocapsae]
MGNCIRQPLQKVAGTQAMSKEEMALMKRIFKEYDQNKDGFIQKDELKLIMADMGHTPTDSELDEIFEFADKNNDGSIDFSEFLVVARSNPEKQALKELFSEFDVDGDGLLSKQEMRMAFSTSAVLSNEDADIMFEIIDTNHDGKIDFPEFYHVMSKKESIIRAPSIDRLLE